MVLSFETRYPLSSFIKRVKKLTDDQGNEIKRMGFGHLLEMHTQTLSKNLLAELMERWSCEKKVFELPLGELDITLMDVALILGLQVTGEPVVLEEHLPITELEKDYGATMQNRNISLSYLDKRLESLKTVVNEDFVTTFLLYTFGAFLFPNDNATIDCRYLIILKDLGRVPQFAWGKAVREDLCAWISKFKEDKKLRYMGSCLIFLQLWSFEHIDIARPSLPEVFLTFPRAYRWQNNSSRRRDWITTKFEEIDRNQIVWKLEPTPEESNIDIIRDLLEKQNERSKLWSTSEYCTSDTADVDVNIKDGTLALEEQTIELGDSEAGLIDKSLVVQEDNMKILSISQYASANDSVGDKNKLRAFEEQESNKEIDRLREVISLLEKENHNLREENRMLRNRFSSSENLVDRLEKIILDAGEF